MKKTRIVFLLVLGLFCTAALGAQDYALRVGDKLRVTIYKRAEISGEYTVRASGTLSVPSIGEVAAAGLTLAALEKAIARKLGLKVDETNHWVGVEVVDFPPIYVLGGVKTPGSYPYSRGMTVVHAISVAGGLRANIEIGPPGRFEVLKSREKLRHLHQSLALSLAHHARLKAEYDNSEEVEFSEEMFLYLNTDEVEEVIERQLRIFEHRRRAAKSEKEALAQQQKIIEEEIRAHAGQLEAKRRAAELLQEEIDVLKGEKAVVPGTHIRALERLGAQIDGDRRELSAFLARAKLQRERMEQDYQKAVNARQVALAEEIGQVEDVIVKAKISIEEIHIVLAQAQAETASIAAPWSGNDKDIVIVRRTSNGIEKVTGSELTELEPGDLIEVPIGLTVPRVLIRKPVQSE